MTLESHRARPDVQKAIESVRLVIIGTPLGPSPLGHQGIIWGLAVLPVGHTESVIVTDDAGKPLRALAALVNVN